MIRSVLSKALALALLCGLLAAAGVYPANRILLTVILVAYAGLIWYRPYFWLLIVPAALPILDFAPWTGWFFLDEFDIFLLATSAVLYWRIGAEPAKTKLPPFLVFSFALVMGLAGIAAVVGLLPLAPLNANAFSNYLSHYNSLRVAKGLVWSIIFLPLLTKSAGDKLVNLQRYFVPGMLLGFVGASLAVVWERVVFPGLTNFSSDYRPTASFSAMHTGGAALDAYLAMTFPLVALWLIGSKSRVLLACGMAILLLGCYVGFTTFSRDVYLAYAVSAAIVITLLVIPHWREGLVSRKLVLGAILALAVLTYLLTHVFATSGYRGLAASLCLLVVAVVIGGSETRLKHPAVTSMGSIVLAAAVAASFLLLRNIALPSLFKVPYSDFLLCFGLTAIGGALLVSRDNVMKSHGMTAVVAAFPGLMLATGLIAYHWGGQSAIIDIAEAIAAAIAIVAILRGMPRASVRLDRNTLGFTSFCAIIFATAIPVSSSYYLGSRFSTVQDDLSTRVQHWREAVDMMTPGWQTGLFGMGLGRYPDTYFWSNMHDETPSSYSYGEDESHAFIRLGAPQYAIGYGEVIRFLQHVDLNPNSAYRVSFDIRRTSDKMEFGLSVCERWMLYPQNCVNAPAKLAPADGNWHHYELPWNSGPLGARTSILPTPVQLEISSYGANSYLDVSNVSLIETATGRDVVRNGSFAHGNDFWFFSSDRNHFPWHVKNFFVNELFETGWVGLAAMSLLLCYVAVNLLMRGMRGELAASVYLASLAGFVIVGLFDSIFDVPRLTLLFFLLMFAATLRPVVRVQLPLNATRTSFKSPEA